MMIKMEFTWRTQIITRDIFFDTYKMDRLLEYAKAQQQLAEFSKQSSRGIDEFDTFIKFQEFEKIAKSMQTIEKQVASWAADIADHLLEMAIEIAIYENKKKEEVKL